MFYLIKKGSSGIIKIEGFIITNYIFSCLWKNVFELTADLTNFARHRLSQTWR